MGVIAFGFILMSAVVIVTAVIEEIHRRKNDRIRNWRNR
jgi:hypothetical protein